ncbi:MAG TPA: alpha/beta fold hydrolase [Solirubrobacteraceae bacterium]|nr:alpha/beta fold hydrolase [Solirubrobacteraceae bacterium]
MEELRIERDGFSLAASYSRSGPTALVALHGAGEGTRDSPSLRHLHELLPSHGIGVVTFDRRGEGESTGEATRGRFELQAEDALAVLRAVDSERVGLWGLSQGGWIGPIAASEQMMYAVERQLRLAVYGDDVAQRALELRRRFEHWVHTEAPEPDERLAADLWTGVDEPWFAQAWLPPTLLDAEGLRLWIEEMDFDPRPVFARVRVPTLLFYGAEDSWTPVEASVEAWRAARGAEVEIVVVPGAEHDLTLPDGSFAPEYERRLVDWLGAFR